MKIIFHDHQAYPTQIQNQVIKVKKKINKKNKAHKLVEDDRIKKRQLIKMRMKQKQQWKQHRHKNKGVMVRKEKKNTVS